MSCPARDVAACCSGGQEIQRSVTTEVIASGKRDMDGGEAPLVICEECLPWPTRDEGSPTMLTTLSICSPRSGIRTSLSLRRSPGVYSQHNLTRTRPAQARRRGEDGLGTGLSCRLARLVYVVYSPMSWISETK